jgi:quinol monooxygenase YgiN
MSATIKYVIGWLRLKPGKRDELLVRIRPFAEHSRKEAGVNFIEVNPSDSDPDVVVFAESYDSEEVHQLHLATSEHDALLKYISTIGIGGRFEHIYADRRAVHDLTF